MTSFSFEPEVVDFSVYSGDTSKISFKILSHDGTTYTTSGSWSLYLYNKETQALLDTDPTGITYNPKLNDQVEETPATGVSEVTISKDLTSELLSTASVVYEFCLEHDGRNDKYTFVTGNVVVESLFDQEI